MRDGAGRFGSCAVGRGQFGSCAVGRGRFGTSARALGVGRLGTSDRALGAGRFGSCARTMIRAGSGLLAVAILLGAGACAAQTPVRGHVVVSSMGPRPVPTLRPEAGQSALVLEGPLADELQTLSGALVEVHGAPTDTPPDGGITVERYVILEIAGEAPFVGRLDASGTQLTLEDGTTLRLEGLPEPIRTGGAAHIWVTGERRGSTVEVRAAGVISRG